VDDLTPVPRTAADILPKGEEQRQAAAAPKAAGKWLTASVTDDAAQVIKAGFDEATRRDPDHKRVWVAWWTATPIRSTASAPRPAPARFP